MYGIEVSTPARFVALLLDAFESLPMLPGFVIADAYPANGEQLQETGATDMMISVFSTQGVFSETEQLV